MSFSAYARGSGLHFLITELMLEPHPDEPVSMWRGGESDAALMSV